MGRYTGKSCRLTFMLVTVVVFFSAEIIAGYVGNSIALVSDSFNMLADIISLSVGLTATRLRRRNASKRYTYGLARVEVVGAMANAVFLTALCFSISVQALERLIKPEPIEEPMLVLVVGSVGLGINIVGLLMFQDWRRLCRRCRGDAHTEPEAKSRKQILCKDELGLEVDHSEDESQPLNIKGVLLHLLNDALGSFVVVVAATIFQIWPVAPDGQCGWQCYVDPSLTLLMVAIILSSAAPLIKETTTILLHITPSTLPFAQILENVCELPGVLGVHDAHVWLLTKGRTVATLHVRVAEDLHHSLAELEGLHMHVRQVFHKAGIHSLTVQLEFGDGGVKTSHCSAPCLSPTCMKISCCPAGVPALVPVYRPGVNAHVYDMKSVLKEQAMQSVIPQPQTTRL
ncbi:calcium/manganese antiporter SLC30A10-like [Brachyhypopomus gauderio]|uniref:calcium/manganese antiporter SLC30A10-like n=1 Tax=Brachyhypopomus gauderio TaxID=698409 RepID=UPI0040431C63